MKKSYRRQNVYAFIDASNIIYGAKAEGWFIDQRKLFIYLKAKFKIKKAFFYYGKDSRDSRKEAFLKKLKQFGFILRVKEIKRFGKRTKANCDVDLTMDLLLKIHEYDKAIILTGDGDFAPLLYYLRSKNKEIIIISSPKRTAKEIKQIAGPNHIDFRNLRYLLEYKKRGRP